MNPRNVAITYGIIILFTLVGLSLVNVLGISYPLKIQTSAVSDELAVVGEGKVDVVPNTATAEVGITVADENTVEAVQQSLNETNNNIIDALTKMGVEKSNIKTSNYSINPNYTYVGSGPGEITGYMGNATVTIKVTKTETLPEVIQAATAAGANQVFNTQYSIDNPQTYRNQARTKAIENAKAQAESLAKELGIRLGKVVNVVESSPEGVSTPFYAARESMMYGGGGGGNPAPDLQPGSQSVTSVVTLYFEKR